MPSSYLPSREGDLLAWTSNFSTQIGALADPTVIGITATDVTDYATLQADFATKYAAAVDPSTRGGATVLAKNEAKEAIVADSRRLAMAITNHPGTTDQQRYDLGLTVRDTQPTPVPVPSESPVIDITSVQGHRINLRLHNGESTSRAKPTGVVGATLFSYVGDAPPSDLSAWKFEGNVTRTILKLDMPSSVEPGSKVWITAFWFNTKSESGPATSPVSTYLGGGLSQAA